MRALGVEDRLVARTDHDTARWAAALPSVGGGIRPSAEAVVSLAPDLVIRFEGADDLRTARRLEEIGIRHIGIRTARIADILDQIELVGRITGADERAKALAISIRSEMDELRKLAATLPRKRTVYVLGGAPPWVAGPGTYIDEVIETVGGANVFRDLEFEYGPVSPEEVLARAPQVVLVGRRSSWDPRLAPGARVVELAGRLGIPGPKVADDARFLFELLHQEEN